MEETTVRAIHDHEWREVRDLRLRALQDEVADLAFVDSYVEASRRLDEFWQQRAAGGSLEAGPEAGARQFVAITPDGTWIGSVTVIVERAGTTDFEGVAITRDAGALVGVYLDPAYRGRGIIQRVIAAALEWVRERGLGHARLYVHVDNGNAQRAYEKAGFALTGVTILGSLGIENEMAREA